MSKLYKRALNKKSLKSLRLNMAKVERLSELVQLFDAHDLWLKFLPINLVENKDWKLKGLLGENPFETETSLYCLDPTDIPTDIDDDTGCQRLLEFPVGRLSLIPDEELGAWERSYVKWLKGKLKDMLD
uniref:Uncharacterized protein n=3 Tax=Candidatus Kentrum sp. SD TaxID=2126332 RepID=A0A451BSD2_9GAMM|nr:MAG: hypothetical protein BECKSD772D_GA0070982_12473 [Candidatus Kentron sp. SD]